MFWLYEILCPTIDADVERPIFIARFVLQPKRHSLAAPRRKFCPANGFTAEKVVHLFFLFLLLVSAQYDRCLHGSKRKLQRDDE